MSDNHPTRINSSQSALVSPVLKWQPISKATPLGRQIQLINKDDGVAMYGVIASHSDNRFTHWFEMPRREDWIPITESTPRSVKMQVINIADGIPTHARLNFDPWPWTHCQPMPTF